MLARVYGRATSEKSIYDTRITDRGVVFSSRHLARRLGKANLPELAIRPLLFPHVWEHAQPVHAAFMAAKGFVRPFFSVKTATQTVFGFTFFVFF